MVVTVLSAASMMPLLIMENGEHKQVCAVKNQEEKYRYFKTNHSEAFVTDEVCQINIFLFKNRVTHCSSSGKKFVIGWVVQHISPRILCEC